jgi:acyl-homoserine-lactone acylase
VTRALLVVLALSAAVTVPASAAPLEAKIQRTAYGVPHITSKNIEGLAAGFAYAFAQDNICTIASEYVTVRAERSRFFGPDETWTFSGNGSEYRNLDADVYFAWVKKEKAVEALLAKKPPSGPTAEVRRGIRGYVAGYNKYLRDVGRKRIPDRRCRGAKWVRPIKEIDVYRRFYQLGILASSGAVISGITNAQPSSPAAGRAQQARADEMLATGEGLERLQPPIGSNAYGFGREATDNGRGLVLGNPHFPWDGSERLYQTHLRIPGKVDVSGGTLYGVPLVLIGHTRGLAWSHTVATAWRFTPFKLTLAPGDPYSYVVDGETKPMKKTEVSVQALAEGGKLEKRTGTIYSTEWGPMITDLVGIPLPWADGSAFALKDVNATNFRYLNHFMANNRAQSVAQYDRAQRRYQGIPWVNSLAADSKGNAYYSMQGAIPYVTDEKAADCNVAQPTFSVLGLPILDGSRSACDWASSPKAAAPGTFPPDEVPTMVRPDYVHNGNDSHWLTNPEQPLTGFDRIIGIENAERTLRTRLGLVQVEDRLAGRDGLPGKRWNRELLQRVMLGNRQYAGELWRDAVVSMCEMAPGGFLLGSDGPVDVSGACEPLSKWSLRDDLDARGAILFRRFASQILNDFTTLPTGLQGGTAPGSETIWTTPFDPADAVHTPSGLNIANPLVQRALADAVTNLQDAKIAFDAPLGQHQYEVRGGRKIPIHGGPGGVGVFNAINVGWDPEEDGYGDVPHGSSFVMAAQFVAGKCPVEAGTFVTYGQSENQRSKHASDYTRAFSRKRWNRVPFCQDEVRRKTLSTKRLIVKRR